MPEVNICNHNPFTKNASFDFLENNFGLSQTLNWDDSNAAFLYSLQTDLSNLPDNVKRSFGYSIHEMLYSCTFNTFPCTTKHFLWNYDLRYGNCYKFNSGFNSKGYSIPIRNADRPGIFGGKFEYYFFNKNKLFLLLNLIKININF